MKPALRPHEHLRGLASVAALAAESLPGQIERAVRMVQRVLDDGGTLFFCGNGGSAADAQHLATEYVVRYQRNRRPLRAIALTTDTSTLTAAANDFSFEEVFARQLLALGSAKDLLVAHTTSGNSRNIVRALEVASDLGMQSLVLTAGDGGVARNLADETIVVPTNRTDRAQELHLAIQHAICDAIEAAT